MTRTNSGTHQRRLASAITLAVAIPTLFACDAGVMQSGSNQTRGDPDVMGAAVYRRAVKL